MSKVAKTNAARILDSRKVKYELLSYVVDENDLSAVHIANTLGEPIEKVFKTLVLHGDKTGYFVCVVPGAEEIDLKKAAKVSGNKKCDLVAVKDLLALTGYIRGGCSPVGMKKPFPTFFHLSCNDYDAIAVSAGLRGLLMRVGTADLLQATSAMVCDLIVEQ